MVVFAILGWRRPKQMWDCQADAAVIWESVSDTVSWALDYGGLSIPGLRFELGWSMESVSVFACYQWAIAVPKTMSTLASG